METLANAAPIILNGAQWYKGFGTEKSAGTKVFALAGDIVHAGIIEVPMGTILGDIIYKIGGGLIVMNEDTCMVDTARYFMDFICDES